MKDLPQRTLDEMEAGRQAIAKMRREERIGEWVNAGKISVFRDYAAASQLNQVKVVFKHEYIVLLDDRIEYPSELLFAQLALILG